ncbi:DUF429 domain-containing protein [Candidatus Woesearchaeota archaeon]|nr:DUF429 domain-containing protein [Candidatus Woesearchaeota archaeon]
MKFVGIDLAWSPKNSTAVSVIDANKRKGSIVQYRTGLGSNKDITDYVCEAVGSENAWVAIDAPLLVPNMHGYRVADRITTDLFRKYEAGTHPANRTHLKKYGGLRGEDIAKDFERLGFSHNPYAEPKTESNVVFEVYPHPAIVVLFNLEKTLKYKPRQNRDYSFRWNEFKKYQNHLSSLAAAKPALEIPAAILGQEMKKLKGKALKQYEDLLDSIMCSYIAFYYWQWGMEKCSVLGDMKNGYILTPVFRHMKTFK